jgi:hypothetical protein
MQLLDLVDAELEAFRKSRRPIHLAHAARALADAMKEVKQSAQVARHVVGHNNGGK